MSGQRVPGQPHAEARVYLGSLLLVLGVFAMFYIRDRRIWIWVKPQDGGSPGRHDIAEACLDFNQEFEQFKAALLRQKRS